jgi:uncharacterized protein (TIGR02145 family)
VVKFPHFMPFAVVLCISLFSSCTSDNEPQFGGSCSINDYKTKRIGNQTWMAENWNCYVEDSYCYNNDPANCNKYGRLYNWDAAMEACPVGWHLPSNDEWRKLEGYVESNSGCNSCTGRHLKAKSGWNKGGNGKDTYGFSALPGGAGYLSGHFREVGKHGGWWSSTEGNSSYAYGRGMDYDSEYVGSGGGDKSNLFSIRCVQD